MLKRLVLALAAGLAASASIATDSWLYSGRIGGTYVYNSMSEADLIALLDQRASENVSILELDSRLSYNLSEAEFAAEVAFLDRTAELAAVRGMRTVIYYPTFEVLTRDAIDGNGNIAPSTFARDNPDWLQRGIDGTPNVFYGGQEVWVSPGEESAWMSPNSGYRDYFIARVEKLAATDLDGVWLDVPIYLDTGTPWTGAEAPAAADFNTWTIAEGLNGGAGYTVPSEVDLTSPGFRSWIKWRHINVANFLDDVRAAAQAINPDFAVVVENFPLDYFDATAYGLDGNYLPVADNFIRVWETDSVSNTLASQWSTPDDFENKIAMLKWGKSVHIDQPSWSFSYGNEVLDAGLTMAATVATQNVPFESKTPTMLNSVDENFRRNWFGYIEDKEPELLQANRLPQLAIWYSSATRDYHDYGSSGQFGMFSVTTPPTVDDTWWARHPDDSVVTAKHLGGYRGMSAAMIRMDIPYTIVHGRDDGPLTSSDNLDVLVLPSVVAMSAADAQYIRAYVQDGGTVLATGELPGTMDELGDLRGQSILNDVFAFKGATARVNSFGSGLAIYRPDITGTSLFGEQLDAITAEDTLSELEKLIRIHVDEPFTLKDGEHIYADRAIVNENSHLLYLVNYGGLQLPLVQAVKPVTVYYNAPAGKTIATVVASTPDSAGLNGYATVNNHGNGVYEIEVLVDQFALLEIQLSDAPTLDTTSYAGPQFDDAAHAEAAQSGLAFVIDKMRNATLPEPNRFGVHTNLLDNEDSTEIYTNGHNVTGEHMGLLLRTSACMADQTTFNEAYRYARELMQSPLYHVPNWSIDKDRQQPFVFFDDYRNNWYNANAPLDDLRLIHGLIDGYEYFGLGDASELADEMLEGLYWTTVTDQGRNSNNDLFPNYPGGLLGFAWDWSETEDASLTPVSAATGTGYLGTDLLPVDYQDLGAIAHAAERDPRWESVLQSATQLLLDSEINLSGLFYNGYRPDGSWTGDFEYQGTRRGEHLKTIQELWTAIHLARVAGSSGDALTAAQKSLAEGSAARSLAFFKNFYQTHNRVPEYLTVNGEDVADCVNGLPANCLARGSESLFDGEVRIYAQMARLALLLGDKAFSNKIINEKIIPDRIVDTSDSRYGMIGLSTAGSNDAEAWNVLESVFSICLNALDDDDGTPPVNNTAPIANADGFSTFEETALVISASQLLANDTDADNDTLSLSGLASRSANGGGIELQESGDWIYLPVSGFNGPDTISYAISDGQGGSGIGQINVDVQPVVKSTHLSESVTILAGVLDYGSNSSLTSDDADTYDIASTPTAQGNIVDWFVSGRIDNSMEVTRLIMTFSGHYSVPNVSQETYLYNFATNSYVGFDTRIVGDESDSIVRLDITTDVQDYIAANGETRVRLRGTHATQAATVWANSVSWLAYRGNLQSGNNVPLVQGVSATTTADTAVAIVLAGNDADGDSLTYALDTHGLSGSISGVAPEITYTPAASFTGLDSFGYTVSDGTATSESAQVTVSVLQAGMTSNIAAAITLDGELSEWAAYLPFPQDPDDVSGANNLLDWRQAWMAHDGSHYYIALRNDGVLSPSWGQTVYIDIDDNIATGFQNGLAIGADRVLQGRFLYRYAGTGTDWNWTYITEVVGTSANGDFEYRFPRSALADSDSLRLAMVGSSEPFGGTAEDLYPDGVYDSSSTNRSFSYSAAAPTNTAPLASDLAAITVQEQSIELSLIASDVDGDALNYTVISQPGHGALTGVAPDLSYTPVADFTGTDVFSFRVSDGQLDSRIATVSIIVQSVEDSDIVSNLVASMNIDGNLAEWQSLRFFENDPNEVNGAENPVDYLRAAMAHDTRYFYLTFSNDGQNLVTLEDWLFTVYIDSDNDVNTGYTSGLAIGADYMQQGGGVFSYIGTGTDWTWAFQAVTPRQASGSDVELAIPRQSIGDPTQVRLVLIGDNFSLGGGVEDVYPDGTYDSNAATRFLEYQTGGTPSEPLAAAAFGDDAVVAVSGREVLVQNARELKRQSELESGGGSGGGGALGFGLFALALMCIRRICVIN